MSANVSIRFTIDDRATPTIRNLEREIRGLAQAVQRFTGEAKSGAANFADFTSSLGRVSSASAKMRGDVSTAANEMKRLTQLTRYGSKIVPNFAFNLKNVGPAATAAGSGINKFGKQTEGAMHHLVRMVRSVRGWVYTLAALRTAVRAAKGAFDFAREGAELEFARYRFDRLAESIGTTSSSLLRSVHDVTKGLYSQAQEMQLVNDIVGLGLAKNADEAVRMARVVGGLKMDINQLVLTLTNQTVRRFDQLGVRVDGFKEKLADLKSQGMDTNAAFTEAFLRQAEEQLELVGERADQTAGSFDKLGASWENYVNVSKKAAAERAKPAIESFATELDRQARARQVWDTLTQQQKEAVDEWIKQQNRLNNATSAFAPNFTSWEEGVRHYDEYMHSLDSASRSYIARARAAQTMNAVLEDTNKITEEQYGLIIKLSDAREEYAKTAEKLAKKEKSIQEQIDDLISRGYSERNKKVVELKDKLKEIEDAERDNAAAFSEATRSIVFDLMSQKLAAEGNYEEVLLLGEAFGLVDKGAYNMAKKIDELSTAFQDGRITADQFRDALEMLADMDGSRVNFDIFFNVIGGSPAFMPSSVPSTTTTRTGSVSTPRGYIPFASGGALNEDWALVGDTPGGGVTPYSELITPDGVVIPHEETMRLLRSGVIKPKSYAFGNIPISGGGWVYTPPPTTTHKRKPPNAGVTLGAPTTTVTQTAQPAASATPTTTTTTAVDTSTQAIVQQIADAATVSTQSAAQSAQAARQTAAVTAQNTQVMREQNMTAQKQQETLVEIRELLRQNNKNIVRAVRDAVQQVVA